MTSTTPVVNALPDGAAREKDRRWSRPVLVSVSPWPGQSRPAIIAGHVDWGGQPGVFFDLRELSPGDDIVVTRQDGSTARFRVTQVEQFDKNAFPTRAVYGDLDHAGLRLITCGGSFDPQMRSYEDNLVVFAELVDGDSARAADQGPRPELIGGDAGGPLRPVSGNATARPVMPQRSSLI